MLCCDHVDSVNGLTTDVHQKRMKSPLITTKTAVGAAMTTNTDHGGGLNPRVTGLG